MADADTTVMSLRECVALFVRERDWEQFHNPKDLAAAIAIEAAELMELFLWKMPAEVDEAVRRPEQSARITEELADIVILCLSLANRLEIDIADAVSNKVEVNKAKYPAELARGKADKYTRYADEH